MRRQPTLCMLAVGAALVVSALPRGASAQLNPLSGYSLRAEKAAPPGGQPGVEPAKKTYYAISVSPIAAFQSAGLFGDGRPGTRSSMGQLVGATVGGFAGKAKLPLEVGGWYWRNGPHDLYGINLRVPVTPLWSGQIGYISSYKEEADALSFFAIYDMTDHPAGATEPARWNIQVGGGVVNDITGDEATMEFSAFVHAAYRLSGNLSLDLSQWYIRDRKTDLNRFTAGLAYAF